jgi:hypothetical protein
LNCRSALPSRGSEIVEPTFGGSSPRPTVMPTVTAAPVSAAHTHRLLNHRAMTIGLRARAQNAVRGVPEQSVHGEEIGLPGFAGSPVFAH